MIEAKIRNKPYFIFSLLLLAAGCAVHPVNNLLVMPVLYWKYGKVRELD